MRKNTIYYFSHIIPATIISIMLFSCESEQRPEPIIPVIPDVVSFSNHIIPIFEGTSVGIDTTGRGSACIECHEGGTPPNLTAENAYIELTGGGYVVANSPDDSKLYKAIKEGGSMNKHTNEVDIAYIKAWIEQGALEN
jgi:hypothetical protein